jgi:phosphinothricin acetyltransferase
MVADNLTIRDAVEQDVPAILAIYNEVIATSTAVYRDDPASLDDRLQWFSARRAHAVPVLVAAADSGVLGFASYGDFRSWPGYRFSVEHTVHIRADERGRGVGTRLMEALIRRAIEQGKHVMIGGVDADNIAEIVESGAEIIVAGSAVYGRGDATAAVRELLSKGAVWV